MKNSLAIILRISSNAHNQYAKRPFGLTRGEMVKKCLKSLLISCQYDKKRIKIYVIEDFCSKEVELMIEDMLEFYNMKYGIIITNQKSNSKTMEQAITLAETVKEDIIYFAEDDYLYRIESIPYMLDAYDGAIIGTNRFAIHPSDYQDRYEKLYPSYIFQGDYCHWRSIGHSTGTLMIDKKSLLENKKYFYAFAKSLSIPYQSEDDSLNKLWNKVPLISPLPSLAAHLNEGTIPKYIKWESLLRGL